MTAIGIALKNDRFHVVVQHFHRHTTEGQKRALMARDQRLDLLIIAELNITAVRFSIEQAPSE